jgi:hypothetical protein
LIGFVLDETPKLVHLSVKSYLNFQCFQPVVFFFCQKMRVRF